MGLHDQARKLGSVVGLDRIAEPAADTAKRIIGRGWAKDALSGTWLGHPLHPMLTDVPIGAFTSASLLDLVGGPRSRDAADLLVAVGLLSAVPTAAAGASDWSDTFGAEQRVGVVHACSNLAGVTLYAASLIARRRGSRAGAKLLGLAGLGTMAVGGYLGGYLSFSRGVGVNNAFFQQGPEDWTPVIDNAVLAQATPTKVEADGAPVLLYRDNDQILAIGGRCSHAGGPLDQGTVDEANCTVQCPWHQSVFRLRDGTVVHGPASVPVSAYDTRVRDGKIEIRDRTT